MMLQSAREKEKLRKRFFIAVNRKLNSGWKRNERLEILIREQQPELRLSIKPIAYRMGNYSARNFFCGFSCLSSVSQLLFRGCGEIW